MNETKSRTLLTAAAWAVILLASSLPKIILQEIFGQSITNNQQTVFNLSAAGAALLASLAWPRLKALRPLALVLLALFASQWLVFRLARELPFIQAWLQTPGFSVAMLAELALKMVITLLIIGVLLLLKRKPQEFYLAAGDLAAPANPVPWLGVKPGDRWSRFGAWAAVFISLGTLSFLVIAGRPPLDIVARALPFLPAVLLAAAMNAFYEEVSYKASILSVLEGPVGKRQAVFLVAAFFGIWHYYGVPYGVAGVLLAGFLGWLLARSMQETRGLFWAWFIHFLQDVWIFAFMAIGSINPGG